MKYAKRLSKTVLDIASCIFWILLASIFQNPLFLMICLVAMTILFSLKFTTRGGFNRLIRSAEAVLICAILLLTIGNFVIYPNTKDFDNFRNSMPSGKVEFRPEPEAERLRLIEIDTNFKETIFKSSTSGMLLSRYICSDNLEKQYRIRNSNTPSAIYEPWTGVKIVCSTLWYNISYIRNGSLYFRNNEIVFDSIQSNGTLSYSKLHDNTLYTYKYIK